MKKTNLIFICLFCLIGCSKNEYIGEQYLGAKYVNNPLGEEKWPDKDPLLRTDAFDCTTFVETVLADGDVEKLNKIRYKNGRISFVYRNHFTELDLLRNNKDIIENVSGQYGKTAIRTVVINKRNWFKKNYNMDTIFLNQTVDLEYIPYSELQEIKIKKPVIVLFISGNSKICDKIGTDLAVVHMGFLLPDGRLRHASKTHGCVIDEDFKEYVQKRKRNKNNLGISLVEIK